MLVFADKNMAVDLSEERYGYHDSWQVNRVYPFLAEIHHIVIDVE